MKKLVFLILLFSATAYRAAATGMEFYHGTWKEVLAEAKKQNKLVFVDIYTTWCGPCKQMSEKIFPLQTVGDKFNASFINYKIDAEKGEGVEVASRYKVQAYPTYLFVNGDGELVYTSLGSMPEDKFLAEADKALAAQKAFQPIGTFDKEYTGGNRTPEFMQKYIAQKKMGGGEVADLLDEYVGSLPADVLNSPATLEFVGKNISSINGKAFDLLASSYKNLLKMPREQSITIIRGLSNAKSQALRKAIKAKDTALLNQVIEAAKKVPNNPMMGANEEIESYQFAFAKAVDDFDIIRKLSRNSAEKLLKTDMESLNKRGLMMVANMKKMDAKNNVDTTSAESLKKYKQFEKMGNSATASQLNSLAWTYFEKMSDKADLEEALDWINRSLSLHATAAATDTKGQLLNKLGRKTEAIAVMKEAVALAREEGQDTKEYEETLAKMIK